MSEIGIYVGDELGSYGFPDGHPFGPDRLKAFWDEAQRLGLDKQAQILEPVPADREALERFHTTGYVDLVQELSEKGYGLLDHGDTPAFPGCFEAASAVAGTVLDALTRIMKGELARAFVPIAGLHHAHRQRAGGFCIFNDCGIAIETLRQEHGIRRVAYVDIDAHHGDGVLYAFEDDPELFVADIHEDGRFIFPGTGFAGETGRGEAEGTKLNIPLLPGADDSAFHQAWSLVEAFLEQARPEFILVQCGADSVAGDPITHMRFTPAAHAHAVRWLVRLAERTADGRVLVTGGGGYNRENLAVTWCGVVQELLGG
jgi:acetoin utilization protein AcuC